ncbi:hypothetical protein C7H84_34255 [Burkholderia sp. Nafp2/4-1b]|uniref:KilA-N domain-containing protein n=1 Tax=Burkholderia sp. Nafp2/4-1b TaxID=2116686 RepID=UPI000EF8BE40|nr:KilA-N domain-containing protein [Burkholderia sp. Nafp2/4-1b]RKT98874.1 hypothetical protein C7H84_34255 [Burkholderia sp. Nafp2/4-1b]
MTLSPNSAFALDQVTIHEIDGLYSLNDLHQASGGKSNHKPAFFLRNKQTTALIAEIQVTNSQLALKVTHGGECRGTFACRELVIAYAAWISPAFHLKVIRVFLDASAAATAPDTTASPEPTASIDVRGQLLTGQIAPTVPCPTDLKNAIDKRAWILAGEAFELIRAHLFRRAAYSGECGTPRTLDVEKAMSAIMRGDLGDALALEFEEKLANMRHALTFYLHLGNELLKEMDRVRAS